MANRTLIESDTKPSKTSQELVISPVIDNFSSHSYLHLLTQEIDCEVKSLLNENNLSTTSFGEYSNELDSVLPLFKWQPPENGPGEISCSILTKTVKNLDLVHFITEMISHWLHPGKQITILTSKQLSFRFNHLTEKQLFVCIKLLFFVEDDTTLSLIKKNLDSFTQELTLGVTSGHTARHILATKALTQDQKTLQVHKTILQLSHGRLKPFVQELYSEMQHVLMASDDEFKRIRDIGHLTRIICYQSWLRNLIKNNKVDERGSRHIRFKLMRSKLHFAFGNKTVLGINIAVNDIKEYELFEAKHIHKACQKVIPHVMLVPHSFFSYVKTTEATHTFYAEIEKLNGSDFSAEEVQLLKETLEKELSMSIEQLSHRLFMPQNEEEVMRNILLLSRELRYVKDLPQVIISFQSQSENSITFHITLVRAIKSKECLSVEKSFKNKPELVTYIPGAKKIVGSLRKKYPKEATTFCLECQKAPFLRQDHSIDLSRARQFVASTITEALGDIRDFNGGLFFQQNRLLGSLKALLTTQEMKQELHLENLFHSISPNLMKSLLSPELIKSLFQLFLKLFNKKGDQNYIEWTESQADNAIAIMTRLTDCKTCEDIDSSISLLGLKELELASTSFKVNGVRYCGYVVIHHESSKLSQFLEIINNRVCNPQKPSAPLQSLRISLPRPTSLLDPRIGTDRTSGIVIRMLYEGLMRIDRSGKIVPAAAKSVVLSEDKKSYTFSLRDTNWSNGKPLRACDFEYAWKKILDPNFKSIFAYIFYPIKNARAIKKGELPIETMGVIAIDDTTLQVDLEYPAPYFLELTSHWAYSPLCREVDELHPGWAYYGGDTYVCNGPFKLARWRRNSEIQAIKNHEYWDKESVHLDKIDISVIENPKTALALYEKGELDWIGEPLSEIPPEAFKKKQFQGKISAHPISAVHWYACNVKSFPFTSQKCRKALAIAINRKALIEELLPGGEIPAYSILPPKLSLSEKPFFSDENPELAKKLFMEGLEEEGKTIKNVPRLLITCCDQELHTSIAHAVARQWKQVLGVDTKIESFKWDRYIEKCLQHDFQLMGTTWHSWYNDPIYNLEQIKYQTGDMNMTQWQSEEYVKLLNAAEESLDEKSRKGYLKKAERLAMEELPIIPIFYYTFRYMKKDHVDNIFLSHLGQIDFKWASVQHQ